MTSGWDVYYVVFLSALLALTFPGFLAIVSRISRRRHSEDPHPLRDVARPLQSEPIDGSSLGRKVNTRFFLGANSALVLITLSLSLIPCVAATRSRQAGGSPAAAALGIVSLTVFSFLALLYAARKGDLDWVRSFRSNSSNLEEK